MEIYDETLIHNLNPLSEFWDTMKEFEKEEEKQRKELIEKPWGEEQYSKKLEYYVWFQEKNIEVFDCFQNEVKQLEEKEEYYFGCSFKIYTKHYEERQSKFRDEYEDATEIDFIEEELQKGIFNIPYQEFQEYIYSKVEKQFYFALKKRLQFLTERSNKLGYEVIYIPQQEEIDGTISKETFEIKSLKSNNNNNITPIESSFNQSQILELARALIETGKIEGNKEVFIKSFSEFFKVEINNPDQLWQSIKARKQQGETIFLDYLKKTLMESFKR